MNSKPETFYITKHALTAGIETVTGTVIDDKDQKIMVQTPDYTAYYNRPHWSRTRMDAVKRAKAVLAAKIAKLQQEIKRLKNLKF